MPDHTEINLQPCSAALFTPRGRGAVATIRVHGESLSLASSINACFHAMNKKAWELQPVNRIVYGLWGGVNNEDLVLCRLDDNTVDIHCHGGMAAIDRILQDLQTQGCKISSSQDLARKIGPLLEVELQQTVAAATTFRAAEILLRQSQGLLRDAFESLLPDKNQSFVTDPFQTQIQKLLRWKNFGLHLISPWRVVLAGRPNVGKSSLINAILGYDRSIVFDEAGTTRDVLTANTAIEGWPFRFSDTAGIRDQAAPLEAEGILRAEQVLNEADCRVILIDTSQSVHPDDQRLLSQWPDSIVIAHKTDLPKRWDGSLPEQTLSVSSKMNTGIDTLLSHLVKRLVPEVPDKITAVPITNRQIDLLKQSVEALQEVDRQRYETLIRQLLYED